MLMTTRTKSCHTSELCIHMHIHMYIHIHIQMHTHTHTYTYTHMHEFSHREPKRGADDAGDAPAQ